MIAAKEAWRAGLLNPQNLVKNGLAGLIVGIVALPMSMAFAIASGVRPENGLYTAIVAAVCVAVFGGTRSQIAGPTGAFIVILAGVTANYGFSGLQIATLMAGMMLIAMSLLRLGNVIKFISEPVIAGFTAGIGVIIFVGEWHSFFGLSVQTPLQISFLNKISLLIKSLPGLNFATTVLAVISLLIVIFSYKIPGKFSKKIPGPLIAIIIATILQAIFQFKGVATLGSVFGDIPRGLLPITIPRVNLDTILTLLGPAFTIALLGSIESLLSATAADGLAGTRHSPNQELLGQGIANCLTPLLGGIAATGAIARTATNIREGGNCFVSAVVHSIFLLLVILLLSPLIKYIPLAALSAILFVVAYNMSDVSHVVYLFRYAPRDDKIVLAATLLLTIFNNLVTAVGIGVTLSMLFFLRKMSSAYPVTEAVQLDAEAGLNDLHVGRGVIVYSINGPLFFGVVEKFVTSLSVTHTSGQVVIFKFQDVPFIDASGLVYFREAVAKLHKRQVKVYLCHANLKVKTRLQESGILTLVEKESVFDSLGQVLEVINQDEE